MASLNVLTFDAEGWAVDFEVWLDDLQLFLQCDSKEGLSLFDLTSGASTAPTADADSTVRSQWLTRDAAARLAVRNHLPSTERTHFSQYKSARALYDAVVARYSSPTTAALSRLMLPYLFPDLAAFSTPEEGAEREMRTVVESVQMMLLHMGVQHHWWHLALRHAVWVRNCLERSTLQPGTTPHQLLTGKKPDLSLARPKAMWGLHLGVLKESKGWELLDIAGNQVVTTSDVVFYENMSLEVWKSEYGLASGRTPTTPPTDTSTATLPLLAEAGEPAAQDVEDVSFPFPSPAPLCPSPWEQATEEPTTEEKSAGKLAEMQQDDEGSEAADDGGDADESTDSAVVEVQRGPRQSGRIRRLPDFYVSAAFTTAYDEADDDLLYDNAEKDEEFPELDPDMHADPEHRWDISSMMVKEGWRAGRARWLVVKGFTQVYGTDYDEMYAPVSSYVTLRIFLSIVAVLDLSLMQLDMKNAFLQSKLDRVLYMHQPDYFSDGCGRVLVYVDDLLAASSSTEMLKELKELLEGAFEPCEISSVHKYLGLEIIRDRSVRKLWLHQQGYADKLRRRFLDKEQTGRTPKTPVSVDAYAELTFDDKETQERQEDEYRQKVGSLQFAATTMRPDIAFAYSKLWSGLTVRSDQYWRKVDRCLAYLANTRGTTLEFGGGPESLKLVSYVDADNAGDKQNRTSTGGYVFVYGEAAVSWSSHRIKCATLSSTESEYVAATEAGKEGRRLRFLLAEFRQLDAGKPIVLREDNKSAIIVAEGMGLMGNLKHMERRQAWL
ncbi:unnamed protein product [Closterium sp. NIES-53]